MKDTFTLLREELESVDRWLDGHLKLPLPEHERRLAMRLQKYIVHCYNDAKKWRSESAAVHARIKLKSSWGTLYLKQAERH